MNRGEIYKVIPFSHCITN